MRHVMNIVHACVFSVCSVCVCVCVWGGGVDVGGWVWGWVGACVYFPSHERYFSLEETPSQLEAICYNSYVQISPHDGPIFCIYFSLQYYLLYKAYKTKVW